ncbi:4a-hydroxytetrahydrobiopterin dehydratase [bacterium]|nr:4a-hydroxytetrahydrobiopterin dehydratase [bacterium]MBP9808321.1 4a-hydroxytetrahydrobiopterin dehydratase [bacterium]
MKLSERECISCRGDAAALTVEQCIPLLVELDGWTIVDGLLTKSFKFKNFRGALDLAILIGALADQVDHHPDLHVSWGVLKVDIITHRIKGLTESDFVLAAKIDCLKN